MKRVILVFLAAALVLAADLTGKWSGSFDTVGQDGSTKPGGAYMDLKLSGQEVTGTAGPDESEQMAISNGKLEGSKLTFNIVHPHQGFTMKFELVFDGESIKGTAAAEREGQQLKAKIDLKRKP